MACLAVIELELTPELQARIDAIVARCSMSSSQLILDALENGHSLEWQERFLDKVAAGIAAADDRRFASPEEVQAVVQRYVPDG